MVKAGIRVYAIKQIMHFDYQMNELPFELYRLLKA